MNVYVLFDVDNALMGVYSSRTKAENAALQYGISDYYIKDAQIDHMYL